MGKGLMARDSEGRVLIEEPRNFRSAVGALMKQLDHDGKAADRATDALPENEFSSGFSCGFNAAHTQVRDALARFTESTQEETK